MSFLLVSLVLGERAAVRRRSGRIRAADHDHDHGAERVLYAVLAYRAEQRFGEPAAAAVLRRC
jgi:hypothetical protein